MGIVYVYVNAVEQYIGEETYPWNSKAHVFLWLVFHEDELLILVGPTREK